MSLRARPSRPLRGYVLLLVLMLAMLLSVAALVLLDEMRNAAQVTGEAIQRKRVFYAADGMTKAAVHLANDYLAQNPNPGPGDLQAWFDSTADGGVAPIETITPGSYDRVEFTIETDTDGGPVRADIPNGPFAGMTAEQRPIDLTVKLRNPINGAASLHRTNVVTAEVSMFQFFAFIDGYAYLYTGTGARFAGRIHANGNICAGDDIYVEKLTMSGSMYLAGSRSMDGCRNESEQHSEGDDVFVATAPLTGGVADLSDDSNFVNLNQGAVHFDRDGAANGADIDEATYKAAITATWNEQIQDQSFGVTPLKLPVSGTPQTHQGRNADHLPELNNDNSRLLVDPVLPVELDDVRAQKFAYKADLRIINGVWYLRDTDYPEELGTPIWSDHPLTATAADEELWVGSADAVGQQDLFGTAPRVPVRYSYYVTDAKDADSDGNRHELLFSPPDSTAADEQPAVPVVSYGTLHRDGSGVYRPGFYPFEHPSPPTAPVGAPGDFASRWQVQKASTRAEILQATRSGFRDGWGQVGAERNDDSERENLGLGDFASTTYSLYNHLPLNFDVQAFKAALADTAGGELGAIFTTRGEPFNGIVYISHTWPGWRAGMADDGTATTAPFWPRHGAQEDCAVGGGTCQPLGSGAPAQVANPAWDGTSLSNALDVNNRPYEQALPYALCSGSAVRQTWHSWTAAGGDDFYVPRCVRYTDTATFPTTTDRLHSRMTSVRIFNGDDHTGAEWPDGLTIASNLPVFVLGDYNDTSVSSDVPGTLTANWKPALVAGDTVSILSNNWSDDRSPWNLSTTKFPTTSHRPATATVYHFQVLAGWLVSAGGSRDEVSYFTRLLEDWRGQLRDIRGSIVIGFNSHYGMRFDWDGNNCADDSTDKTYMYDYNLDALDRQPPGAPRYIVNAVRSWRRD